MFCPATWQGPAESFDDFVRYPWMRDIVSCGKNIYCAYWLTWHEFDLPQGYAHYVLSYHVENVNLDWIIDQQRRTGGSYVVLFPGKNYNIQSNSITLVPYIPWDQDLRFMHDTWGSRVINTQPRYKFSAICNRLTQSKVWITTKLLEDHAQDSAIVLNDWLEPKNVHHWQPTGNVTLDQLTEIFKLKYLGVTIKDDFDQTINNEQSKNSNPWQKYYTDSALHFTNASFHYSYMQTDGVTYIYPGPDIDEKTFKCILAGTAFVPCAQFDVYGILQELGFRFDYGFDTTWDQDSGNLSRFASICKLIDTLGGLSVQDIVDATIDCSRHNQKWALSEEFKERCAKLRQESVDIVKELLLL